MERVVSNTLASYLRLRRTKGTWDQQDGSLLHADSNSGRSGRTHSASLPPSLSFGVAGRASCDAPYPIGHARSSVTMSVRRKRSTSMGSFSE